MTAAIPDPPQGPHILVADDDADLLRLLGLRLESAGYRVSRAASAEQALSFLAVDRFGLLITDLRMGGMDGLALLRQVKRSSPTLPVILLTAHGTIPDAVEATRQGAFGFVTKPFEPKDLLEQVARALGLEGEGGPGQTHADNDAWRRHVVTHSPLMHELLDQVRLVAESGVSVLVHGESGTGKEVIAQAIHDASGRVDEVFLAVNCGAIPEDLLESELFGHRKGAFTGAHREHKGLFQSAHGGTLLLDEIGDMPLPLQVKLLRVLEQGEVKPVGASGPVAVDVRIISATHQDLEAAIKRGTFREDLFYRLNVVSLTVPPLRERREDVPLLTDHFLKRVAQRSGRPPGVYAPESMEYLVHAPWPGNVRQLYNVVEQTVALSAGEVIPLPLVERAVGAAIEGIPSFAEAREGFEREYLVRLLKVSNGNVANAARMAKRNRTEFYRLLQRHSLTPSMFKRG